LLSAAAAENKRMAKLSIRDLWGRLTQKKAMNPDMRNMLLKLDGVYEPKATVSGEAAQTSERPQQEHTP
jgi:hypothetical protein